MTALCIIGGIVLFFLLIGMIPVGADIRYNAEGLLLRIKIWFIRLSVGGAEKPKKEKPAKLPKKKESEDTPKPKRKLPSIEIILILIRRGFSMLGSIVSRFRVERLKLHFLSASDDPADAAMIYAAAGTGMDMLLHLGGDRISHADLHADVDFDRKSPEVDFHIVISIRIGAVFGAALRFGFGFLKDYLRYKKGG